MNKSKMIILAVVVMAIVAIFLFSSSNLSGPGEEVEIEDSDMIDTAEKEEENLTEFKPADNPFAEYIRARENKKPIVLEFYARW